MKILAETSENGEDVILMEDGSWKVDPESLQSDEESDQDEEEMPSYFKRLKGIPIPPSSAPVHGRAITTTASTTLPSATTTAVAYPPTLSFPIRNYPPPTTITTTTTPTSSPGKRALEVDSTEQLYQRVFGTSSLPTTPTRTYPSPILYTMPTPPTTPTNVIPHMLRTPVPLPLVYPSVPLSLPTTPTTTTTTTPNGLPSRVPTLIPPAFLVPQPTLFINPEQTTTRNGAHSHSQPPPPPPTTNETSRPEKRPRIDGVT